MPWYNKGKYAVFSGETVLLTDTIKVMLVGPGATFDPDDNFISDLTGELSGTGYVAGFGGSGRKTLQGKSFTEDDATDYAYLDGNDLVWVAINAGTAAAAVLVREMSSDADSVLLAFIPFSNITTNGGDLNLQWSASGILRVT